MDFFPSDEEKDEEDLDDTGFGDEEERRRRTTFDKEAKRLTRLFAITDEDQGFGDLQIMADLNAAQQAAVAALIATAMNDGNAQAIPGSQLGAIDKFTGEEGLKAENFLATVDRSKAMFVWGDLQTRNAAILRMSDTAQTWIRALETANTLPATWEDPGHEADGLKAKIKLRFGLTYTTNNAVEALGQLQQKQAETAAAFLDRVRIGLDLKNYAVVNKQAPAYLAQLTTDTRLFFLAGVKEELRQRVVGVPNAPENMVDILAIVRAAEAEIAAKRVVVNQTQEGGQAKTSEDSAVNALKTGAAAKGRRDPKTSTCYGCGAIGHFHRDCTVSPMPKGGFPSRGGGRGGRGRGRGNNYNNYNQTRGGNSWRGGGRGQFPRGGASGFRFSGVNQVAMETEYNNHLNDLNAHYGVEMESQGEDTSQFQYSGNE